MKGTEHLNFRHSSGIQSHRRPTASIEEVIPQPVVEEPVVIEELRNY